MRSHVRPALTVLLLLTAVTGIIYPLGMTGLGTLLFPGPARGSVVMDVTGAPVGSRLIAQPFAGAGYFQTRPSAVAADASLSSGSNLGPTNPALADSVRSRATRLRAEDPTQGVGLIPADLVTASGSGLDPDISPAGARWQALRVARARGLPQGMVDSLVASHTERRLWGLFGEPRVNVLTLNLALDSLADTAPESR